MQPSKALQQFTNELKDGQSKPMAGYLSDMVFGMTANKSTMLSEIGRALGEDAELITTEMRLSRNLSNRNLNEDAVREHYLESVAPFIQDAVIALDFSEIRKDYSEKQEWLCDIWDNSKKEKARGYWLLNIEAVDGERNHFPLWLEPFSQVADGYQSQAHVVKRGMERVASHAGKECVWVLDRGFDGSGYVQMLEEVGLTYCIRQVGKRNVIDSHGELLSTAALAEQINTPYRGQWRQVKDGKEYSQSFRYGSRIVTFPKDGKKRRLIIVRSGNRAPMMLLTNALTGSALRYVIAYFKRWGIEEGTRLVKQVFDLENVRAMSFAGIRRLTLFAYLAYGFLCLFAKRIGKDGLHFVLGLYKSFGNTPHFLYYRLANAVSLALLRAGP